MTSQTAMQYEIAGLGARLASFIIDWILASIWQVIVLFMIGFVTAIFSSNATFELSSGLVSLASVALALTYYWYFWTRQGGQTPGKRVMGLRVVSVHGQPITTGAAVLRWIGYTVNTLAIGLGWIGLLIDDEYRGWHDKMAGTLVVRAHPRPVPVDAPQPRSQSSPLIARAHPRTVQAGATQQSRKSSLMRKLLLSILVFDAVVLFAIGLAFLIPEINLALSGETVEGEVTDRFELRGHSNAFSEEITYFITYRFGALDESTHFIDAEVSREIYFVLRDGAAVEVKYLPGNPSFARLAGDYTNYEDLTGGSFFLFVGLAGPAWLLYVVLNRRKTPKPQQGSFGSIQENIGVGL